MRINRFVALATGLSRRSVDQAIKSGRILYNETRAHVGQSVTTRDTITLDGRVLSLPDNKTTVMLHKPLGYVSSRKGQGNKTVYELLPPEYARLKPIGRLDKNSSGLLLLTTDGRLAYQLTHPRFQKRKIYRVELDKPLAPQHRRAISRQGVYLEDGLSRFRLEPLDQTRRRWRVSLYEGRNRQIRRTFAALGYRVTRLHRTAFGQYTLGNLEVGNFSVILDNRNNEDLLE